MTSSAPSRPVSGRSGLLTAPAVAGVAYLAAWLTGLAVWPSNLDVAASGSQVVAAYTGHRDVAMLQSLLVHGVAAVALAIVVLALGQAARHRDAGSLAPATVVAGVGAAVVSLVQCALGLLLAGWAVPDGDSGRAGDLFAAINRLDGVKMLALAAMAASGAALVRRTRLLPGWLGYLGVLLAVALVVSGIGLPVAAQCPGPGGVRCRTAAAHLGDRRRHLARGTSSEAVRDPEAARDWKGWRGPGTQIRGVIVAGTFHQQGDRVFWDVHDAAKAVVIRLADERYARLVVGVDDPAQTVAAIRQALGTTG